MTSTSASTSASKYIMNSAGLYVCPHCDETKARKNTMFYHIKKHTGALDYVCSEPGCGKGFLQKSGLDQHRLQAHPTPERTMWGCPCCEHTCPVKANMMIHIGRMHGSPWIPAIGGAGTVDCAGCKKVLASPTAYFYHAVSCFKIPLEPIESSGPKASGADVL